MNLFDLAAKITLDSSSYERGLKTAENKGSSFAQKLGGGLKTASVAIGAGLAASSAAVIAFGTDAVKTGASFDTSMSQVAATMGKTVDEIQDLREYAQKMGAETAFSASQAADALNYMALAGYDSKTSMAMLPNVLNLAAAGNIELARASDMVTDAQSALGIDINETTKLVDKMAKTASKSNTSVAQLGDAILTVGGTAKNLSGGTTELNQVLGLLADNGIKGAEAGTHLRNILLSLTPTSDAAAEAFEQIGLQAYTATGEMRPLEDIFTEFSDAVKDMSTQDRTNIIQAIFNKTDISSVNALLSTSKDRWRELSEAIDDSTGAAQKMADTQLDNLNGDITLMKSALEGAKITLSNALTPALRKFVQFGTKEIGKLDKAFQRGGIAGLADQFGKTLGEATKKILSKIPDIIKVAGKLALSFVDTVGSTLTKNASKILRTGINVIKDLASGLIKKIPDLMGGIGDVIGSVITNIPDIISLAWNIVKGLAEGIITGIPKIAKGIWNGIKGLFTKPLSEEMKEANEYIDGIHQKLGEVGMSADEMYDKIAGVDADVATAEYWARIYGDLHDKTELTKTEQGLLNQAVEYLNTNILPETDRLVQDETGHWSGNTQAIYDNIEAMKQRALADVYLEMMHGELEKIAMLQIEVDKENDKILSLQGRKDELTPTLESYSGLLKDATLDADNFRAGVGDITPKMRELAESVGVQVDEYTNWNEVLYLATLKQEEMQGELESLDRQLTAHSSNLVRLNTDMAALTANVNVFATKGAEAAAAAEEAGVNTAEGYIRGMNSKMAVVRGTGERLSKAALDGMKSYAMIKSPSKRADKEIGQMIDRGYERGLLARIPNIEKASEAVAEAAMIDDIGSIGDMSAPSYAGTGSVASARNRNPIYLVLDTGELVGKTIDKFDRALGIENAMMLRWEGAV